MPQPGKGGHGKPHTAAPLDGRKAGKVDASKGDVAKGVHVKGTKGKGK